MCGVSHSSNQGPISGAVVDGVPSDDPDSGPLVFGLEGVTFAMNRVGLSQVSSDH